jgi:hypothetical protein
LPLAYVMTFRSANMAVIVGGGVDGKSPVTVRMRQRRRVIRQNQTAGECRSQKCIPDKLTFPVMDQVKFLSKLLSPPTSAQAP